MKFDRSWFSPEECLRRRNPIIFHHPFDRFVPELAETSVVVKYKVLVSKIQLLDFVTP